MLLTTQTLSAPYVVQSGPLPEVLQKSDFEALIVFDWEVNRHWTHEVLKGKGRRISITLRALREDV